jgi:hypothetical protein
MAGEWAFRVAYLAGFVAGLITFLRGFAAYRKCRLVADTPDTAIRGVAMGLVQVHGQARVEETLLSPVSRTPCCISKVTIEEWQINARGEGKWADSATDIQSVKFYLADATGGVLVDPIDAELDLPPGASREVDSHSAGATREASGSSVETAPAAGTFATDAELLRYVALAESRGSTSTAGQDSRTRAARLVLAKHDPGGEMVRAAREVWKHPQGSAEFDVALEQFAQSYARALASGKNPPDAAALAMQAREHPERVALIAAVVAGATDQEANPETEKTRQLALAYSPAGAAAGARHEAYLASGLFRLTEYSLVPGETCHITGTCAENPHPRDDNDRNIIMKGINEPTFLISSKAGKAVQSSLRKSALGMVLGGGALATACLALFLQRIGLL